MYVQDAIEVFGSRARIAEILHGVRHRSAVYQWPEDGLVPYGAAFTLAKAAPPGTACSMVNPALYEHAHKVRRRKWRKSFSESKPRRKAKKRAKRVAH